MKQECEDLVDEMDYRNHRSVFSASTQVVNIGISLLLLSFLLEVLYEKERLASIAIRSANRC